MLGFAVLGDHLILANPDFHLGVVIGDAHHVSGIHLADQDPTVTIPEGAGILQSPNVKPVVAGFFGVIRDLVPGHRMLRADGVHDRARVEIFPVLADSLVREDVTLLVEGDALVGEEPEQLLDRAHRRVVLEAAPEVHQGGRALPRLSHLDHAPGKLRRDNLPSIADAPSLEKVALAQPLLNRVARRKDLLDVLPLLFENRLAGSIEVQGPPTNGEGVPVDNDGDAVMGDGVCRRCFRHCYSPMGFKRKLESRRGECNPARSCGASFREGRLGLALPPGSGRGGTS